MSEFTVPTADPVSPDAGQDPAGAALSMALRRPRYEVLPVAGTLDQVEQHVPSHFPVTVTASPRRGLKATLTLTETLSMRGYQVVPHLAARSVVDEAQLADILQRIQAAGVTDAFVIAGDGHPVGDFTDSVGMLTVIHRLRRNGAAPGVRQIGVAGYPEGHPYIPDVELGRALLAKQLVATYVVSQICFDATVTSAWVTGVRRQGIRLPLYVGVTGAVDKLKLLRTVRRIGIGPSAKFLRLHRNGLARLVVPGGYRPSRLVRALANDLAAPARGVVGLHVYTLGDVASTERWRRRMLDQLIDEAGDG